MCVQLRMQARTECKTKQGLTRNMHKNAEY